MKKKIVICAFLLLIVVTAIGFTWAAVDSYRYDMDPANGVDILEGFGAVLTILVGGFVIVCEIDLFFTVSYFFTSHKTLLKSCLMILSQLMLLTVIFSNDIAHFLSQHVSSIFQEEIIVIFPLFFFYLVLRVFCVLFCYCSHLSAKS